MASVDMLETWQAKKERQEKQTRQGLSWRGFWAGTTLRSASPRWIRTVCFRVISVLLQAIQGADGALQSVVGLR